MPATHLDQILKGTLQETLYTWPDQDKVEHGQSSPPEVTKVTSYGENQVTYMSDKVCRMKSLSLSLADFSEAGPA